MHSKWKTWDYFKSNPRGIDPGKKGMYSFYAFDSIITKMWIDRLPRETFYEEKINVLMGKELTKEWLEDNLQSLGLFGNEESYLVHYANEIRSDVKEMILNEELILESRFFILCFDKSDDFFKALSKKAEVNSIEIQAPMFWESRELLEFFSNETNVYLDYQASQYLQDVLEPTCSNFYNLLSQLKLHFGEATITKDKLEEILVKDKLDNFLLADFFGTKNLRAFYERVMLISSDNRSLQLFFSFMQKHLGRMYSPDYLQKKSKLSKYDRQILAHSKIWKKNEIGRAIDYFKELEVEAKLNYPYLMERLKRDYLRIL